MRAAASVHALVGGGGWWHDDRGETHGEMGLALAFGWGKVERKWLLTAPRYDLFAQ